MKCTLFSLSLALRTTAAALSLASLVGCSDGANDKLAGATGGTMAHSEDSLAAGENTFDHPTNQPTGENEVTDPQAKRLFDQTVGTPEVVARLHGCTKLTFAALKNALTSRGVAIGNAPNNQQPNSAASIYLNGRSALGVANYGGRVPEALFASTSAMAKQFDIFIAAAGEIQTSFGTATGCNGVALMTNNLFTKEGISCLIGKPARDEHVALANNLVSQATDAATGQKIAIAALLEAAHTCE